MLICLGLAFAFSCAKEPDLPGSFDGGIRLPNHWVLTPAGNHIPVGDLPLNMTLSPDGSLLAVTNNGYTRQFISLIDTATDTVKAELTINKGFYGLAFSNDGQYLYSSGGADDCVLVWHNEGGVFMEKPSITVKHITENQKTFPVGLALTPDGRTLYVAGNLDSCLTVVDLNVMKMKERIKVGAYPYDIKKLSERDMLYVSLWGESAVCVCSDNEITTIIPVGDHPNMMALSPDESLLYIACANTDDIWVIDTVRNVVTETIKLHPYPDAPFGSTPNAIAVSPDGKTLYVANATNNDVAVIDVSVSGNGKVVGLIPVGWYPTAVKLDLTGSKLYVANAKGMTSKPNVRGPNPYVPRTEETEYIGGLFNGSVSSISVPNMQKLAEYTKQVERNNGFNEAAQTVSGNAVETELHAIPRRTGEPSLIDYVVYIIKENRTYDQVFGDIEKGNGDPSICIFGEDVTPNHHALAEQFVLFDNLYVDAEVSADGHEWSTAAIATDFVEKTWPTSYSGRGLSYPSEGAFSIAYPTSGYIWEAVGRKGLSYRSYGEFIAVRGDSLVAQHHALEGHFSSIFKGWDMTYPDTLRAESFITELKDFEKKGEFPRFTIMRLPNDHTAGTRPGASTPRAMVADNDIALGKVIEALSHSIFWPKMAIFVIEDDAQNGSDHVDAHRTIALAVSPYIRRGYVDNTLYDTVSILRTMELILGIPPMSQYDAAAYPLIASFTDKADLTPYTCLRPTVPLDEINSPMAYGASESLAMNFSVEDATPEIRLNEIIWKSIRGVDSEMPRPINNRGRLDDDDD